jgi:radical SAM protein with 4Fe4S-binding SPASM domain
MPSTVIAPTSFVHAPKPFAAEAEFVGMTADGEHFQAQTNDPYVWLRPIRPMARGWYRFSLEAEGGVINPRLYFDFGGGASETWSVPLTWSDALKCFNAVAWVPRSVVGVRFDPSDEPSRFRIGALRISRLPVGSLADALSPRSPQGTPKARQTFGAWWSSFREESRLLLGDCTNTQVFFSDRSHLSGASVHMEDLDELEAAAVRFELFAIEPGALRLLRTVELSRVQRGAVDNILWDPVEESAGRFFLFRAQLAQARGQRRAPRLMRDARAVNSDPEAYFPLPHAILFSPVTQCNLNCTHCISRFTRSRFKVASERVWEAVSEMARQPEFVNIAMDYSGDILFDEVRHGGCLSRVIGLGVPFRVDTNASYLDEPVIGKLLDSRLFEINFSIDSMDAELYPKIRRGAPPLEEVLGKVAAFMHRKRSSGKSLRTIISFVLMRSNAQSIKPAFEFARLHGIDFVSVVPMTAFTEDMVDEVFIWDDEAYARLYHELSAEATRCGVGLAMQPPVRRWLERDAHKPCYVAHGTTVILGNGDVMPCCVPGPALGNLNDQSLHEIWHGAAYREFRTRVNTPNPPQQCRNCPMSRVENNRKAYAPVHFSPPPVTTVVLRRDRA